MSENIDISRQRIVEKGIVDDVTMSSYTIRTMVPPILIHIHNQDLQLHRNVTGHSKSTFVERSNNYLPTYVTYVELRQHLTGPSAINQC